MTQTEQKTVTLPKYQGKRGYGTFRPMTLAEVKTITASHVWFVSLQGDARQAKVNGAPKTWKRSPERVELPIKYGMYEYGRFDERDIANGRLLIEIPDAEPELAS